jgi:septum formation protein
MIYLASASPRRGELLEQLGIEYQLLAVNVDETPYAGEVAEDYVQRLALAKAEAGWQLVRQGQSSMPVLAADTTVVVDGQIIGKPPNRVEGLAMLQTLSGRCHQVFTAVALVAERTWTALSTSKVCFRELTPEECQTYWLTGEPADKAGAYAIQGLAAQFISHLSGSYSGVMGLPLYETAQILAAAGIDILPQTPV